MQSIFIEHLEAETIIGVYPEERVRPQTLIFDIEIGLPSTRGFRSDLLGDTIDYAAVAALVKRELLNHSFNLLERLADHLCEQIERETDATQIRLKVAKTGIVPGAQRVGVIVERGFPRVEALFGARVASREQD